MSTDVHRGYQYDKAFNLVNIDDVRWNRTQYRYNTNDQIVETQYSNQFERQSEKFQYDNNLNITEHQFIPSDTQGAFLQLAQQQQKGRVTRRITAKGYQDYHYDINGRLTQKMVYQHGFRAKTWYYQWNTLNQLIACFNPEGECWRYTYDAFGRRLSKSKVVDNRPTPPLSSPFKDKRVQRVDYLWSGNQMVQETPLYADGTPAYDSQIQWLYQPGEITPTARYQRGKLHYVVTDHQGTPREIFSEKGIVSWAGRLNTWGQMTFWQSHDDYADNDPEYTECHFRFAGQYEDKESGLYYNRFRYYDKDTGQYISPDPIGLLGGLNPYSYVHSPTKFIDPLGLAGGIGNKGEYCKPDFYVGPAGSSATMPSKAYRYMNSQSEWSAATLENKTAPLSYFGYTKYGSGKEARDAYQIFYEKGNPASWSDARLLGEFDTLQLYKNGVPQVKVPLANGGKGPELELFTSAYPQYGKGGAVQLLPVEKNLPVTFDKVTIIPE